MKGSHYLSESATLQALGSRLAAQRLAINLTQAEVAEQAGVSKRTVERLESGATGTQLSSFLRVCVVLGLQDRLDLLVPEPAASPVAQLKLKRQARKRASSPPEAVDTDATKPSRWVWEP